MGTTRENYKFLHDMFFGVPVLSWRQRLFERGFAPSRFCPFPPGKGVRMPE